MILSQKLKELKDHLVKSFFKKGHCICQAGKSTIISDCQAFCQNKTHQEEYLYAEFVPGVDIITNPQIQNTRGWCTREILDSTGAPIDGGNPSCRMTYVGNDGSQSFLDSIEWLGNNSLRINVGGRMVEDVIYILTLQEFSSGAKTNSVQILKGNFDDQPVDLGPLKIAPVNQYTCMSLGLATVPNDPTLYIQQAYPLHFYYVNNNTPPTVPPNVLNIYCHDIQNPAYTRFDKPEYPRLQLIPNIFNFWNQSDPRFYDLNNNQIMDVHEEIQRLVQAKGGSYNPATQPIFFPFSWPNFPYGQIPSAPNGDSTGGQSAQQNLGYIMTPWIDQQTFRSYCPNQSHYYSNNVLFQSLRDLIGVSTEALYMSIKENEVTIDDNGNVVLAPNDYLLIREGLLKQIWFYIQNGQKFAPTNENVANHTVHFYWPPNPASPFIRQANQRLYTIRHPQDMSSNPATDNDALRTNLRPHDKRFACIPAIE
jgi:hypothetical protein